MDPSKRRGHPRVSAGLITTLELPDGRITVAERLSNISLQGLFVEMTEPLPLGCEVGLEFKLPVAARIVRCRGLVVRTVTTPGGEEPPGIGLRLMDIGIADMRVIAEYIEQQLRF